MTLGELLVKQKKITEDQLRTATETRKDPADKVEKILVRLTLAGAIYVTVVCLLPEFLILKWNVPFYFGGTSLLIVVSVTMDTVAQIQSHMLAHQYEGLIKRSRLRGARRP